MVRGAGTALINRRRYVMRAGVLLRIERGDHHEVRNDGKEESVELNFLRASRLFSDRRRIACRQTCQGRADGVT